MMKSSNGYPWAGILTAISLATAGGMFLLQPPLTVLGQGESRAKTANADARSALAGDLKRAIELVEKNEFRTFLELYCPVEMLRKLRQQDLVDRAATVLASQPKSRSQLLIVLNALKAPSGKFDKSGGMVTLEFDTSASGLAEEIPGELNIPETFDIKLNGFGSDLPRAIAESIKLLEAAEFATFVDRLYPASELARLQDPGAMQALLQQFKETPELARSIIADLQRIQPLKASISKDGKVATYTLSGGVPKTDRTIKFEKVGADWRLFDDSPRVVTELTRQAKMIPGSEIKVVQMEWIGGNWRFIELPSLRLVGP